MEATNQSPSQFLLCGGRVMKYIRTKDGQIIALNKEIEEDSVFTCRYEIVKMSDDLYDLIQDGDLLKMTCRLWLRTVIADVKVHRYRDDLEFSVPGVGVGKNNVLAWWIQLPNGDYHKVAEKNEKGDLVLI